MNTILIILTTAAGLIALLLIIGLFSKKRYIVESEITIHKPKQEGFNYIKFFEKTRTITANG